MTPPIGQFGKKGWESFVNHPQSEILKWHIDRAIQDMFLESLRSQLEEFVYIFNSEDEIEKFVDKIVVYREANEEYEVCSEAISLKNSLLEKWRKTMEEDSKKEDKLKDWLRNSL